MDVTALANQVASMPCFIVLAKEANFTEGMNFVNYIETLPDNTVQRKKKHFILITQNIENSLIQNRSGNANVHIISQGGEGENVFDYYASSNFQ